MKFSISIFIDCLKSGFGYLDVTAKIAIYSALIGIILGMIIALLRYYKIPFLGKICSVLISIYQGVPIVIALLIYNIIFVSCFNDVMKYLHINLTVAEVDITIVGIFTIALHAVTVMSETFRGALFAIPRLQFEAGDSVGLTKIQTLYRIIIPQMIPVAIPGLINNMVGIIKGTALVSAIGIVEVMNGSLIPGSVSYSLVEGYAAAAIIYWAFTFTIESVMKYIEKLTKRYRRIG